MTEPDNLGQKIHALQQWQRAAWQQLADPMLTTFDRREIRNQIKQGVRSAHGRFKLKGPQNIALCGPPGSKIDYL